MVGIPVGCTAGATLGGHSEGWDGLGNAYSGAEHEEEVGEGLCPAPLWAEEGFWQVPLLVWHYTL